MRLSNCLVIACFWVLAGCDQSANQGTSAVVTEKINVTIQLNAPADSLDAAGPVKFDKSCLQGLCFYEISKSANEANLPSAIIKVGDDSLALSHAISIVALTDQNSGNKIQNVNVKLRGLPDNSSHEKNRDFIYSVIDAINNSGWHHYYFPGEPRIPGSEAGKIPSADDVLGGKGLNHPWFDPSIKISLSQWVSNTGFYKWYFYKDGVYLLIRAWRSDSNISPELNGNYLVSLEFRNEADFWKDNFESEDMPKWRQLLPEFLVKSAVDRQRLEAKARANGIKIDETYQDPPIKALGQ
jgi:hypothetical protein